MGVSLWDQVWLPLSIGIAIQIAVAALCFLSVRLWNCLMEQIKTQKAAGESGHDPSLPDGGSAAHVNGVPDLETGNGHGTAEAPMQCPGHESRSKRSPCATCGNGRSSFPARGRGC